MRSISKELAKKHEVVVYTTTALDSKHDFDPKEEEVDGYRVIYFKRAFRPLCYSGILGQLNLSFDMMKAVKQNLRKFDVVHVHSWQQFPDIMVGYYANKYKIPWVLQVHGSLSEIMPKQKLKRIFDLLWGYELLSTASKIIALNQTELQQYLRMGVFEDKIEIILNGTDLSDYDNLPSKKAFKKKLGLNEDERIVLYLGRIHKIKGIDVLVKAFANIDGKLNNVRLVIVGPDDGYLVELEALIKALGIDDNVLIPGPLYGVDKLGAYVDADVYVLPSRYETSPMTVLESVACGTPVILTDVCGIAEYFRDKTGLVVKTGSTAHLQEALVELLMNREKQKYFREECKSVIKQFSILVTVKKLEEIYKEL